MAPRRRGALWPGVVLAMLCALAVLFAPSRPGVASGSSLTSAVSPPAPLSSHAGRCESNDHPECRQMRFSFPVHVTPGANYQLAAPTIGKPAGDGYLVRFEANLVRANTSVPPVDEIHLHHAVWLANKPGGALLPFYGVGEEKTATTIPDGYGWRVRPTDTWLLNFMIHNLTPVPETVYVVWDVDFIPRAAAEREGIVPVSPLAVEIRRDERPLYPVFNVQRRFGTKNPVTGRRECSYPRQRCAEFDPYGEAQPGNGRGYDYTVTNREAGTIVSLMGHLHPGGLRDELSIVRKIGGTTVVRPLFTFEAVYFDGGDPVSWDFGMTVTPPDWRVRVRPGDRLRLNAFYDAGRANWYEAMGVVYGWIAPGDGSGINPFRRVRGEDGKHYVRFPRTGPLAHGHLPENDNHGGELIRALPAKTGPFVRNIGIANFAFQHGDMSRLSETGIPRVAVDGTLTFRNYDAIAGIWHTITTCKAPCTGTTGVSYPIADGQPALDSLELGWTPPPFDVTQASGQRGDYAIHPEREGLSPGNTYTYFCRVHPFMRGAFKVVE